MTSAPLLRPATATDVPALVGLAGDRDVAWWGQVETDADEVEAWLDGAGDLTARTAVVDGPDGRLDGAAVLFGTAGETHLVVRPGSADREAELADALVAWARGAGATEFEVPDHDRRLQAAYRRGGLAPTHSSFELERPDGVPAPAAPAIVGAELRPFDKDDQAAALHRFFYDFWAETPGHHDRPLADWRHWFLDHASYDPHLQLVAWSGERIVGAAVCRVYPADGAGWVMQLGVARDRRRTGLGRALLTEATRRLQASDGVRTVGLSVQAANADALRLYLDVGFVVEREWITFGPAADPSATEA